MKKHRKTLLFDKIKNRYIDLIPFYVKDRKCTLVKEQK